VEIHVISVISGKVFVSCIDSMDDEAVSSAINEDKPQSYQWKSV